MALTLEHAVSQILRGRGWLPEADLLKAVHSLDSALAEVTDDDLLTMPSGNQVMLLSGDRWVWLPTLLVGKVLTHRVSQREIENDLLDIQPDLEAITWIASTEAGETLQDGSPVTPVLGAEAPEILAAAGRDPRSWDRIGALMLAEGQLSARGLRDGDMVALGYKAGGYTLERVDLAEAPTLPPDLGPRLRGELARDDHTELIDRVWVAFLEDPDMFAKPLPPLGELIESFGLTTDGRWLGGEDVDLDVVEIAAQAARVGYDFELTKHEAEVVVGLTGVYDQTLELFRMVQEADESEDAPFEDAPFEEGLFEKGPFEDAPFGGDQVLGDSHEAPVDRDVLMEHAADLLTDPHIANALLVEIERNSDYHPAALDLFAHFLEPRLPMRARGPVRWLRAKAYDQLGITTEAEAAYRLAEQILPGWEPVVEELARYASDRGDAVAGLRLLSRLEDPAEHPLFELLTEFAPIQHPGLGRNDPCWCGSGRKYKKCHLGKQSHPLEERARWLYKKAGRQLLGYGWRDLLLAALEVRSQFDEDDSNLMEWLGDPTVQDIVLFEGGAFGAFLETRGALLPADEQMLAQQWILTERSVYEITEARPGAGFTVRDVRTGDVHEVRERTASRQLKRGEYFCARVVPAGDTMQVFGGFEPVGLMLRDELIALLDSDPEPLDLLDFLTQRFAPLTVVDKEGNQITQLSRTHPMPEVPPDPSAPDLDDPELTRIMQEMILTREKEWVDESIPALKGFTPREAAADPTRRDDLIRLLNSFPEATDDRPMMSPARLREALELPPKE